MTIRSLYPASRPSLDLNFAKTKRLDPRITFSRASTGTYFGSDGLVKSAAVNEARFDHTPSTGESLGLLVEEARTNIIVNSEYIVGSGGRGVRQFNAGIAPDGRYTASRITESIGDWGTPGVGTWTYSIFVKQETSPTFTMVYVGYGGVDWIFTFATEVFSVNNAWFNAAVQKLPNGWYRLSATTSSRGLYYFFLGTSAATTSVLAWGLQVEAGSFPTSYIPTPVTFTSRASTATFYDASGVIQTAGINVARSNAFFPDSNGVMRPAGLLLEAAGTNLLTYSEQFDNAAWTKSAATVSANSTTAPDGTSTADSITEDSANTLHFVNNSFNSSANVYQTYSVFLKANGRNNVVIAGNRTGWNCAFNLSTGQAGTAGALVSAKGMDKLANGWYRCWMTIAPDAFANVSVATYIYLADANGNTTYAGNGTSGVFAWGYQVEQSAYPTSYIATTTATVTRSADVSSSATVTRSADVAQITGTNFSSWFNATQGTLFGSGTPSSASIANQFLGCLSDNTDANFIGIARSYTNNVTDAGFGVFASSSSQAGLSVAAGSWTASQRRSLIGAYAVNDFAFSFNGGTVGTDASGLVPNVSQFRIGGATGPSPSPFNGAISRLAYWPTRLPDSILQSLTQ